MPQYTGQYERDDSGMSSKFQTHTQRLINRDGSFNIHKKGVRFSESFNLYHHLINISWLKFSFYAFLFYIVSNLFFTFFYVIAGTENLGIEKGNGILYDAVNAFFFSAQTLTTVGFGFISPRNFWTNVIATFEAGLGLMVFAIATGLMYGRFSKPTANLKFSKVAILTNWKDGLKAFQFRVANAYETIMMDAEIQVMASWLEKIDGTEIRKYFSLKPEYQHIVFFPTIWTVNHIIDSESPLYGKTHKDLATLEAEIFILFKAYDDTFNQTVNARFSYRSDEIIQGVKYVKAISIDEHGKSIVEINKISDTERINEN